MEPREGRDARESTAGNRTSARQHRLNPGNAHRNAMLESLPAEQRPIAQQLLRGGIPAVRTALHFERERAREEGRPEPSAEGVLALAESLVSRVKAAEWRDRAEAAIKAGDDLAMRDLRSLVSGSDIARDEASRGFVVTLRELLERRVEVHRKQWEDEVAKHLEEGHVLRALRLSARPPDAGARFSSELASRLRDAASVALAPSLGPDRWLALLEAVAESPVRRTVKPEGLPSAATPELLQAARQQCGRVPALAPLLGLSVPPPPGPARPVPVARAAGVALGRRPRPTNPARKPVRKVARHELSAPAQAPASTSETRAPLVEASTAGDAGTSTPLGDGTPADEVATPPVEASPVEASPVEASPVEASPVEVVGARELPEALAAPQTHGPAGEGEEMGLAPAPGEAGP